MIKKEIRLTELPDEVVLALRSNEYVSLWYSGKKLEYVSITNSGPEKPHMKYRLTCSNGQYRSDEPIVTFLLYRKGDNK